MIELVNQEAVETSTEPGCSVEANLVQKPVTKKIVIEWIDGQGVVNVSFDNKDFQKWSLILAALDMAKGICQDLWDQNKMTAMAAQQREIEQAARLQAKLAHEQNNNQQRRR